MMQAAELLHLLKMGRSEIALIKRSAEGEKLLGHSAAPSVCCKRLFVWIGDGLGTHGCEHRSCLAQAVHIYFYLERFLKNWIFKMDFSKMDFPKLELNYELNFFGIKL